ncbi:hypothetical protein TNCV_3406651 [Trichonephila clavipes]|nr:hypothetical protein TNCV_3406651 [Trichonephila clavipes]
MPTCALRRKRFCNCFDVDRKSWLRKNELALSYAQNHTPNFADINPGTLEVYLSIDRPHQASVQNEPFMKQDEF